jgi:type I restriction enzyme R subunit
MITDSGYSIVFLVRKVLRRLGGNYTFLVLTDRDDLDSQIYKTFAGCGLADNDREPCRAESGDHLVHLLGQHQPLVFSLIQKFNRQVKLGEAYTNRNDIIVITDEAHRTQYGNLALNMRNALPNASYIGFTGTPLFQDDEITRRVFGEYISTYDFQRAVDDNATVPLYYEARGDKLGVALTDINERLAEKLEELEPLDVDVTARLEKELAREYHVITAPKRLERIAEDFVGHFSNAWESGKAMFVCIDKLTCVTMYNLILKYWDKKIFELEASLPKAADEQETIFRQRQIAWMRESRAAVVVSEEQGEVAKFRQWGLDIIPHRKLMKEGMDLPESLRQKPKFTSMQRLDLESAFKEREHPFRIAVVCAMWLTGFDVPCLSTLYLDKPLKAHTLMQAIARANRVDEGKNNGLIVDYCGILKNLHKALATFTSSGGGDGPEPVKPADEDLIAELREAIALVRAFLAEKKVSLDAVISADGFLKNAEILSVQETVNENDSTRKRFGIMCRNVFKKFKACLNLPAINEFRDDYGILNIIYKRLQEGAEQADISYIIRKLHEVIDDAVLPEEKNAAEAKIYDISKIDFNRLRREFAHSPSKNTLVQDMKTAIEKQLQRLMARNPLRTDFQKRYEEIVDEYNKEKDRATIEQIFDELLRLVESLNEEEGRAVREGLDEENLVLYDLLRKPELTPGETKRIKSVAVALLETLKAEKHRIDHWQEKEATRDTVKLAIRDFLWNETTGLPLDMYTEDEVMERADAVYQHVFRVYPTVPSPYYSINAA